MKIFSSALALPSFSLKVSFEDSVWVLLLSSALALPSFSLKVSFGDSVWVLLLLCQSFSLTVSFGDPVRVLLALLTQGKDIVFRFIIEYSSSRDLGP
jgi:hypothetical protein